MADSQQVLAGFVDVLLVFDQLVLERLLQGDFLVAGPRQAADGIHHEVEVVQIVQHRHIEECGDGTLFLVDADVDVVMVNAAVGQPVERPHFDYFAPPSPSFEAGFHSATLPSWLDRLAIVRSLAPFSIGRRVPFLHIVFF